MINVLIVDDDKLVRKGLISAMPWAQFGMRVVAEAGNGERALEQLETNNIHLMMTDLAMPVMSGIELMREAHSRYPELFVVVLTLHQNFEYVQEALRLGALDYVAKVQLEKEQFDDVLARIAERMRQETAKRVQQIAAELDARCDHEQGILLVRCDGLQDIEPPPVPGAQAEEIDHQLWLQLLPEQALDTAVVPEGWLGIIVTGLHSFTRREVHRRMRIYRQVDYFYEAAGRSGSGAGSGLPIKSVADMPGVLLSVSEQAYQPIKEKWRSFEWIRDEQLFEAWLNDLEAMRLPPSKLASLLEVVELEWNRVYAPLTGGSAQPLPALESWHEADAWLRSLRNLALQETSKPDVSKEITDCILKAVVIIESEYASQLHAAEVAKRVGMSRGYFSQCFKQVTGKPFHDYLRQLRMDKAAEYLRHSGKPIGWIAEQTGYLDEKYFSRIFREYTGLLPSEYRSRHSGG